MNGIPVKILSTENITHNVRRIKVERPLDYDFIPGQATEVSLPSDEKDAHPFTFTGLKEWDHLEFSIKIYPEHKGLTDKMDKLKAGDEIILHDVWGAIQYNGPGVFIAGGAGVTPFIAILRDLYKKNELNGNVLCFSNKKAEDIILKDEFTKMLGNNFINTLTAEKNPRYRSGKFNEQFFRECVHNFKQHFYVCGPDGFVEDMKSLLQKLGASAELLVFEK